jgi:hypothetical protein
MVWICCASGRSLVAGDLLELAGVGSSLMVMPTPMAFR